MPVKIGLLVQKAKEVFMKKSGIFLFEIILILLFFTQCSVDLEKSGARLEVAPGSLRFTATDTLFVITVKNMGNEDLHWKIQTAPEWLLFSKARGEITAGVSDTFSVTYKKSLLDTVVEFRDNIILSSNTNSEIISVTFQSEQPSLKVSASKLELSPSRRVQKFAVENSRNGYLDWKATPSVEWLTVSPDTGHTDADAIDSVTVTVLADRLPVPGEYSGAIQISSDANGPLFTTKISAKIDIKYFFLGIDTKNLRENQFLLFPVVLYQGNSTPISTEFLIQPIGARNSCRWEIISGSLPSGIEFSQVSVGGTNTARFTGSGTVGLSAELRLRLTDALNSSLELPVTLAARQIEVNPPQMTAVAAGNFTMGDSWGDGLAAEQPAHSVTLREFEIGKFEVTNAEFYQFVLARGYQTKACWLISNGSQDAEAGWKQIPGNGLIQPRFWNLSETPWDTCQASNLPNAPVIGVSWFEALAYCQWLSAVTGQKFTLPTEAQWERAARGTGAGSKYPWGNVWDGTAANWDDSGKTDGFSFTAPVGHFERGKTPGGCYDLAGNAWEWCLDWYAEYAATASDNPTGPLLGSERVVRGGSWKSISRTLRTAARTKLGPVSANTHVGFRLVRVSD
jgi:formylglycine-generating enzyme required for sulfatase activity